MTAFAMAFDVLFADPNLSETALWRAQGLPSGDGVAVRVLARSPDAELRLGQARVAVPALVLRVRVAEVAQVRKGDVVEYRSALWRVTSDGVLDREGLVWLADVERQV